MLRRIYQHSSRGAAHSPQYSWFLVHSYISFYFYVHLRKLMSIFVLNIASIPELDKIVLYIWQPNFEFKTSYISFLDNGALD